MTKNLLAPARSPRSARRWELRRNALAALAVLGVALATLLASSAVQQPAVAAASELTEALRLPRSPLARPIQLARRPASGLNPVSQPPLQRMCARSRTSPAWSPAAIAYRSRRPARWSGRRTAPEARAAIDPLFIVAVIAVESRFNPIAQSDGGAMGLMQVIPHFHADKFDAKAGSVFDPETNIQLGATVLKDYISKGGTEIAGLQLYNGSSGDLANSYAHASPRREAAFAGRASPGTRPQSRLTRFPFPPRPGASTAPGHARRR